MSEAERLTLAAPITDGTSLMAQLARKRQENAKITTVDLDVPGYGGELVATYKLIDPLVEGRQIGERIKKQFPGDEASQTFHGLVDLLLAACVGLYLRDDSGKLVSLDPSGEPIVYEERLAEGLGIDAGDPPSARNTLIGVFNGNKVAVTSHALALQQWMADPTRAPDLGKG